MTMIKCKFLKLPDFFRKSLRVLFQGAEMVVLPALVYLHLPDGHLLGLRCQGLCLALL